MDSDREDPVPALMAYVRPLPAAEPPLDEAVQRTAVRACALGEGLGVPEVYEEAQASGRAAFSHVARAAAEASEDGGTLTVVVATVAVLGDSALERARRVVLLESLGARLIFADGASPEAALREDWEGRPGEERRRERAREGMRNKALRAEVLGRPPYGYAVEERALVPHPREAPVVQRMFREYVEQGEGLRRIAAGLDRDGIRTRLGRAWSPGSVRTVLRNPVYTGLYRRLGVVVASAHPLLVDRGTFQVVQRRLTAKRTSRLRQERHEYLLGGLLRCGRCGSPMIGDRRPGEAGVAVTYRCEAAVSGRRCRARSQREATVLDAVRREIARSDSPHPVAVRPARRADAESRRQRLERRLTEGVERWAAGEWRYSELVRRMAPTVQALHEMEAPAVVVLPPADEALRRLVQEWDALDPEELRVLLRAAIAEVTMTGREARITLRR